MFLKSEHKKNWIKISKSKQNSNLNKKIGEGELAHVEGTESEIRELQSTLIEVQSTSALQSFSKCVVVLEW
jgi:hypothetical protein